MKKKHKKKGEGEYLLDFPVRMFPSMVQRIDQVLQIDKKELWVSKSQFVRSAVSYYLRSNLVRDAIIRKTREKNHKKLLRCKK